MSAEKRPVCVRIEVSTFNSIERLAKFEKRTLASLTRILIEEALDARHQKNMEEQS